MKFYKKVLKYRFFVALRDIILYFRDYTKRNEMKRCYGRKNSDKTFYVIRNYTKEAGWGSILNYVCLQIDYALSHDYIPVVDMCNYHNAYEIDGEYKKINVWEKFFYQLTDYTLEEVYSSRNVILCGSDLTSRGYISKRDNDWEKYSRIYSEYIRLKPDIEIIIDSEIERVTEKGTKKLLGLLCRGTDYTYLKPLYHGIPYTADEAISDAKKKLRDFDRIYLATEDSSILDRFVSSFDEDILFFTSQERYSPTDVDGYLSDVSRKLEIDPVKKGIDYLCVLYTLAKCNAFCGAPCGGSYMAILINGGRYSSTEILSKGNYE